MKKFLNLIPLSLYEYDWVILKPQTKLASDFLDNKKNWVVLNFGTAEELQKWRMKSKKSWFGNWFWFSMTKKGEIQWFLNWLWFSRIKKENFSCLVMIFENKQGRRSEELKISNQKIICFWMHPNNVIAIDP